MLRRLQGLFSRYETQHLIVQGVRQGIFDDSGAQVGFLDRVEINAGRLHVTGWAAARRVTLLFGSGACSVVPDILRPDVGSVRDGDDRVGFELDLPVKFADLAHADVPGLVFEAREGEVSIPPHSLSFGQGRGARAALRARFLADGLRALPPALRWLHDRDPRWRHQVKGRLGLDRVSCGQLLDPGLFASRAPESVPEFRITIILPVYNAFDLLEEVLDRVRRNTDLPWRLLIREDCSTDPRVRPFLREWVARWGGTHRIELHENPRNLGFIGSVNAGLARALGFGGADEGPVVLLNSDAFVPPGWARRLIRPILADPTVASVTPLSNDAEINTAPVICQRTVLGPGQADAIDRIAARLSAPEVDVPTGVGFCMAIARGWLARVPALDPVFGRGYGEEVDWCQKVRRKGGRHRAIGGLFVEHRGGESFGSTAKLALIQKNNDIVSDRYPGYDLEVQDFIASDPMLSARLALGLAWAGTVDPEAQVPVYIAHSLGGGADCVLEETLARETALGRPQVVLRVGGARKWQIELVTDMGRTIGQCDDDALVAQLLAILPRKRVIYSCGVGARDMVGLPAMLVSLLGPQDSAEILFHDYFPLSPSYTLLDSDGVYRGPVCPPRTDRAHLARGSDGALVSLEAWQAGWYALAARADLTVFSQDSADQVTAVWPDLAGRIRLRPHALRDPVERLSVPPYAPPVLAVLGNIGQQKGLAVLRDLAERIEAGTPGPGLVLVGNHDPAMALPARVQVHGSYRVTDLARIAQRYGITHWLIPSIWPETFCFTVREALATGLPVLAFDLGAQGEAVHAALNGFAIPFRPEGDLANAILSSFAALSETEAAMARRVG